jgi:hypothetical protein
MIKQSEGLLLNNGVSMTSPFFLSNSSLTEVTIDLMRQRTISFGVELVGETELVLGRSLRLDIGQP